MPYRLLFFYVLCVGVPLLGQAQELRIRQQYDYQPAVAKVEEGKKAPALTKPLPPPPPPVPLNTLQLRAETEPGEAVRLLWYVPTGQIAWTFLIERSLDLENWAMIGQVNWSDTVSANQYRFVDNDMLNPTHYRITHLDKGGKVTYTRQLSMLNPSQTRFAVNYYSFDEIALRIGLNPENIKFPADLLLYNQAGQLLCADTCRRPTFEFPLDITGLPKSTEANITLQIVDASHRVVLTRRLPRN